VSAEQQRSGESAVLGGAIQSLLDQAIEQTVGGNTRKDKAEGMVGVFVQSVMERSRRTGEVVDASYSRIIDDEIKRIDELISRQLNEVMHHAKFQKLEGSWRGLHYLFGNSNLGENLRLKMLNCREEELRKDFKDLADVQDSHLFQEIHQQGYGINGGVPFGALVGDFQFGSSPKDIDLIKKISKVAAMSFAPFLTSASPQLLDFDSWDQLSRKRRQDLEGTFVPDSYIEWRAFRESEDARYVTMCLPRTMARLPYGNDNPVEKFDYAESPRGVDERGKAYNKEMAHDDFCWMNSAYVLGAKLTDAFARTGWCTGIRGYKNGGLVEDLPTYVFRSEKGDIRTKCPVEVEMPDDQEKALSDLGFLPLVYEKNSPRAVFFGGQTVQKPKRYPTDPKAEESAELSARLPYILAVSRIAHVLKIVGRTWIGAEADRESLEKRMNNWINQFVGNSEKRPLLAAKVAVEEIEGRPGSFNAVAHVVPKIQLETLTASIRLVARLDK